MLINKTDSRFIVDDLQMGQIHIIQLMYYILQDAGPSRPIFVLEDFLRIASNLVKFKLLFIQRHMYIGDYEIITCCKIVFEVSLQRIPCLHFHTKIQFESFLIKSYARNSFSMCEIWILKISNILLLYMLLWKFWVNKYYVLLLCDGVYHSGKLKNLILLKRIFSYSNIYSLNKLHNVIRY